MKASPKRVVFVGGGHAHLYALKRVRTLIEAGADVVLIGPGRYHYYTGMGPGLLSGRYRLYQIRFDLQNFMNVGGGRFIQSKVIDIRVDDHVLILANGSRIDYDLVSFNIGSYVSGQNIPGATGLAYSAKPIKNMVTIRRAIIRHLKRGRVRIVLIGGGPASVELAGNVWQLVQKQQGQADIFLVTAKAQILTDLPARASRLATFSLQHRGIQIITNFRAHKIDGDMLCSRSGAEIAFDIVILATGIMPPDLFRSSGLQTDPDGSLKVNSRLQALDYPEIFGAGDCITIQDRWLPRTGVYAVRQAPVIFHNMRASLLAESLKSFTSRRSHGLMLNMGDGSGIFIRAPFVAQGRWAFHLKEWIDQKFIAKYH